MRKSVFHFHIARDENSSLIYPIFIIFFFFYLLAWMGNLELKDLVEIDILVVVKYNLCHCPKISIQNFHLYIQIWKYACFVVFCDVWKSFRKFIEKFFFYFLWFYGVERDLWGNYVKQFDKKEHEIVAMNQHRGNRLHFLLFLLKKLERFKAKKISTFLWKFKEELLQKFQRTFFGINEF